MTDCQIHLMAARRYLKKGMLAMAEETLGKAYREAKTKEEFRRCDELFDELHGGKTWRNR